MAGLIKKQATKCDAICDVCWKTFGSLIHKSDCVVCSTTDESKDIYAS